MKMRIARTFVALGAAILTCTLATPASAQDGAGGAQLVNAAPTSDPATAGALLFVGPDARNQFFGCSGVMIGCRTFLTAAHCLCEDASDASSCEAALPETAELRVFLQHSGIHFVRQIEISPDFEPGVGSDLAVLTLSSVVEGVSPATLNDVRSPRRGKDLSLVGFGTVSGDSENDAIKRVGDSKVKGCRREVPRPGNFCWKHDRDQTPEEVANSCEGDDGGPVMARLGFRNVVAGIIAGSTGCERRSRGYASDVYDNLAWIRSAGGADIENTMCGNGPHVGDQATITQREHDGMQATTKRRRYSFQIPSRTTGIRVAVNGNNTRDADYNMYVSLDNEPTKGSNDCAAEGQGRFGVCELEAGSASTVNVLVQHVRQGQAAGRSRFQVTVTTFRTPADGIAPAFPDNLRAGARGDFRTSVTWRDNSSSEEGYLVQRKIGIEANEFFDHALLPADSTGFVDNTETDRIYTYRVRAFNESGDSLWSNLCIVHEPTPKRPNRLDAISGDDGVQLTWNDRSNNDRGFQVQRKAEGDRVFETLHLTNENEAEFLDTNARSGETYTYRVRAQGATNQCVSDSAYSRTTTITVP